MTAILRQLLFLAASAGLTWWFLLRAPVAEPEAPAAPLRVAIEAAPPAAPAPEVAEVPEEPVETEPAPPPSERGAPEGEERGRALAEAEADERGEARETPADEQPDELDDATLARAVGRVDPEALASDPELVERARAELAGDAARGFATELVASAADQLEIARSFGEELVLVPWDALAGEGQSADWFRLGLDGEPRVERVAGPFEPGQFRFHRDLFDYEYAELPAAVRTLRRAVVARDSVYLFAALIPTSEWAVVVGRRDEALAELDLSEEEVRRFRLRYVPLADGRFDLRVVSVELADGRRERFEP